MLYARSYRRLCRRRIEITKSLSVSLSGTWVVFDFTSFCDSNETGATAYSEVRLKKPIQQAHLCLGSSGTASNQRQRFPLLVLNTFSARYEFSFVSDDPRTARLWYTVYSYANTMSAQGPSASTPAWIRRTSPGTRVIWTELEGLKTRAVSRAELRRPRIN